MEFKFVINTELIKEGAYELPDFQREEWESYLSASGSVLEDVMIIDKVIKDEEVSDEDYGMAMERLGELLSHEFSFYDASYLALPYLVKLLEQRYEYDAVEEMFNIIMMLGPVLATENEDETSEISEDLLENYNKTKLALKELTKIFLMENVEFLQELDQGESGFFASCILAILDDGQAAKVLMNLLFEELYVICENCEECNEDIDSLLGEEPDCIEPAEDVTGQWDGNDLSDTYMWFANFLEILGNEGAKEALKYYYGTYTCLECGAKMLAMDGVKNYIG